MDRCKLFIPKWARHIQATKEDNLVIVTGESPYSVGDDPLISAQSGPGKSRWMHIEFANAETEPELLDFVSEYGPVDGSFVGKVEQRGATKLSFDTQRWLLGRAPTRSERMSGFKKQGFKKVTVEQPIKKLREAQESIAAATRLVALGQLETLAPYETMDRLCGRIARSLGAEGPLLSVQDQLDFIKSGVASKKTIKQFEQTEALLAGDLLRQFLDKFPPRLGRVRDRTVELPGYDETGILPILCYLLRQDFLSDVRTIGICERCRRLFVVRRRGAQFCSAECSQLKRALDYYHSKRTGRSKR
jgi:hypothetical protein